MNVLRRSTIHEDVIREIGALIRQRGLTPGSRLPTEEEFCRILGIGRGRLREAIRVLSALGYVDVRHGGGMYLAAVPAPVIFQPIRALLQFGIVTQLELLQIRRMIEVETIAQATRTRSAPLISRLTVIVDRLGQADLSVEELVQLDLAFHFAMVEATGNQTLLRMFAGLGALLGANLAETLQLPGAQRRSYQEHREILAAVQSGDEARARGEMIKHLLVVEERLRGQAPSQGRIPTERSGVPLS